MPTQTLSWASTGGNGSQAADFTGVDHNVGDTTVRVTLIEDGVVEPGDLFSQAIDSGEVYTSGNYDNGSANSALELDNAGGTGSGSSPSGDSDTVSMRLDFTSNDPTQYSDGAQNVTFWISDIDRASWIDQIRILAFDENGQLTDVSDVLLSTTSGNITIDHATDEMTATGGGNVSPTDPAGAVQVTIPGPITHLIIDYDNLSTGDQRVEIGDITFDTVPLPPICFVKGTRIRTPDGEIAVDNLKIGDLVETRDHGAQALRWVGSMTVSARGADFAPIHFAPGVIGNTEELALSPEHRVLVGDARASLLFGEEELLVAARTMVDGDRIWQSRGSDVTYFHLMFDAHELIWSEGCLSESFCLNDKELGSVGADTRQELLTLFPELDTRQYTTPLARTGLKRTEADILSNWAS